MSWQPAPRTPDADAVHAAAEADRRANPERYRLEGGEVADALVARALGDASADALGDPAEWRDGAERYLASAAEDGRLGAVGARMVRGNVTGRLQGRIALRRLAAERPDVGARPLAPPIVIVGGWRTGTTFLFRCLATDPRLRAPLPAELTRPTAFVDVEPAERERLVGASAKAHDLLHLLNPAMAAVHDSGPRLPEECVLAMGTDLRNWGFASTVRLDGYVDWLASQDLGPAYRAHALVLRALDAGDGRRWLLKAPAHTAELPSLAAAFPGACVVHLHRDVVETVASGASLFATFRSTYSDDVDAKQLGAAMADQTELWLRRAEAFRADPAARGTTILDLPYRRLVEDPAAAMAAVYAAAGMDPPADLPAMLEAFHAAQPRGAHGPHRYAPDDFGLVPGELRERFGDLDRSDA